MTSVKRDHMQAIKASGVKPFRLYDLRDTSATRAAEGGVSALEIQKLLGHSSLATTARYIHLSKSHLSRVQKSLETYRAEKEIEEAGEPTVLR